MWSKPNLTSNPELVTRLLNKRDKAHNKARDSANESNKANRRAKQNFYNSVNNTLRNRDLSAKKKFSILFKLMKNNKFTNIPSLIENNSTINDPLEQSNIFTKYQPSGEGGAPYPPATPHRLQNPKWPPGGPKMADGVWKGVYP